jgi:hypothetical protein
METNDAGKMGTAIDYGIRFYLQKKYAAAHPNLLIAQLAVKVAPLNIQNRMNNIVREAMTFLNNATSINRDFAYHCWQLANIDTLWRTGLIPKDIPDQISNKEIVEFLGIMKGVTQNWPIVDKYCVLNPTFGIASNLVNGADADVVQDDVIVDIKTIRRPNIPDLLHQLVGYAALEVMDFIDGKPGKSNADLTKYLGGYFARHDWFVKWPIEQIVSKEDLEGLAEFFTAEVNRIAYKEEIDEAKQDISEDEGEPAPVPQV